MFRVLGTTAWQRSPMSLRTRIVYASLLVGLVVVTGAVFYGIKSGLIAPKAAEITDAPGLYGADQNLYGAVNVVLAASGNVGIGTPTPDSFFSIANRLVVNGGSANQGITIATNPGHAGTLAFVNGTGDSPAILNYIQTQGSGGFVFNSSKDFNFRIAGGSPALYISNNGNVGIGTTSPAGLLDVGGGKFVVNSNGNVGIGTTNPQTKLDVSGEADITLINAHYRSSGSFANGFISCSNVITTSDGFQCSGADLPKSGGISTTIEIIQSGKIYIGDIMDDAGIEDKICVILGGYASTGKHTWFPGRPANNPIIKYDNATDKWVVAYNQGVSYPYLTVVSSVKCK